LKPAVSRYRLLACTVLLAALSLVVLAGSAEKWHMADLDDTEIDTAFFKGLNAADIPNVPEPTSLRRFPERIVYLPERKRCVMSRWSRSRRSYSARARQGRTGK
jgi:hypothetical protein